MAYLRINIIDHGAVKAMDILSVGLEPLRLLDIVGQRLLRWVAQNFKAGGIETKWKPLSLNTIAARRHPRGQKFGGRRVAGMMAGTLAAGGRGGQILRDTGRLAQSFTSVVRNLGEPFVEVGTPLELGVWHHFGTRPYTIRPRTAKMLHFMTARGPVFKDVVHHPGLPSRPLLPTKMLTEQLGIETIQKEANRLVGEANRSDMQTPLT